MLQIRDISLPLGFTNTQLTGAIARRLRVDKQLVTNVCLLRQSLDARKKQHLQMIVTAACTVPNETGILRRTTEKTISAYTPYHYPTPEKSRLKNAPVIVGSGPAGLFAAYVLAQAGARPILLERGQSVSMRQAAVQKFWKTGVLDPECNVQFGEGGAGTFSDGKLTTGTKDLRIRYVLETLVSFGAPPDILYLAKPHIGTDRLASTVQTMRQQIEKLGGTVLFGARFTDYTTQNGQISAVTYLHQGQAHTIATAQLLLAVGHSARDVFSLLQEKGVALAQKGFAVGVRIEHLQTDINRSMYGKYAEHPALSAADYKLVSHLPNGRNLYTFCMCPGGQVVSAASEPGRLVTNGMSCYARDGKNANSALLVGVTPEDFGSEDPLAGVAFQRRLEEAAFLAGGQHFHAPVSLVGDFMQQQVSTSFGRVLPTYQPGTCFALPDSYLPDYVCQSLRQGIRRMGASLAGFSAPDAILTGIESRSSSPVRILRGETCESVSVRGMYPCGEGAGYAGGIVSAAVDGIRCAEEILAHAEK